MVNTNVFKLLICAAGIYTSFLTWALVQEPLTTRKWPNSNEQFQFPNVIAVAQAIIAMTVGYLYLNKKNVAYRPWNLIKDHASQLLMISFTQSASTPLATYSLCQVDYLTYMLAKSCKMIPVLLVHLLLYRTPISSQKKIVAILVSLGVTLFTIGSSSDKKNLSENKSASYQGFLLLGASLFMDGLTNATQDNMFKAAKLKQQTKDGKKVDKTITGAHLMFALNMFIILWNILYLGLIDRTQLSNALKLVSLDPEILYYLATYAVCGAIGQCFIFYALENYGSLVLVMITVTRKMMSMVLSIIVFGKTVDVVQWIGILIVFAGITWEATSKKKPTQEKKKTE